MPVGERLRDLVREICDRLDKGHVLRDQVHLFVSLPPRVCIRKQYIASQDLTRDDDFGSTPTCSPARGDSSSVTYFEIWRLRKTIRLWKVTSNLAQMCVFVGRWLHQGEERDLLCAQFQGQGPKLYRPALLGARGLRVYGWCDEIMITECIRAQETEDQRLEPSQEPADHLQVVPMPLVSGPT